MKYPKVQLLYPAKGRDADERLTPVGVIVDGRRMKATTEITVSWGLRDTRKVTIEFIAGAFDEIYDDEAEASDVDADRLRRAIRIFRNNLEPDPWKKERLIPPIHEDMADELAGIYEGLT